MSQHDDERDLPTGLSAPARRALATIGVTRLDQLTRHRERDVLALHGMGPKGIRILRAALVDAGLSFTQDDRDVQVQ